MAEVAAQPRGTHFVYQACQTQLCIVLDSTDTTRLICVDFSDWELPDPAARRVVLDGALTSLVFFPPHACGTLSARITTPQTLVH